MPQQAYDLGPLNEPGHDNNFQMNTKHIANIGDHESRINSLESGFSSVSLIDGATINIDASQKTDMFKVTLSGNRTLANPTSLVPGKKFYIWIYQDATGGRTLTFGSAWNFPNKIDPVLSSDPLSLDILSCMYDGAKLVGILTKDFG